jgi:hypothetical protein
MTNNFFLNTEFSKMDIEFLSPSIGICQYRSCNGTKRERKMNLFVSWAELCNSIETIYTMYFFFVSDANDFYNYIKQNPILCPSKNTSILVEAVRNNASKGINEYPLMSNKFWSEW